MPKILDMEQTRRGRNLNIHPNVNVKKNKKIKSAYSIEKYRMFLFTTFVFRTMQLVCSSRLFFSLLIIIKTIYIVVKIFPSFLRSILACHWRPAVWFFLAFLSSRGHFHFADPASEPFCSIHRLARVSPICDITLLSSKQKR